MRVLFWPRTQRLVLFIDVVASCSKTLDGHTVAAGIFLLQDPSKIMGFWLWSHQSWKEEAIRFSGFFNSRSRAEDFTLRMQKGLDCCLCVIFACIYSCFQSPFWDPHGMWDHAESIIADHWHKCIVLLVWCDYLHVSYFVLIEAFFKKIFCQSDISKCHRKNANCLGFQKQNTLQNTLQITIVRNRH